MVTVDVKSPDSPAADEAPPKKVLLIGWRIATLNALSRLGAQVWCVVTPDLYRRFGDQADVERAVFVSDCADVEEILCALQREGLRPSSFDIVSSLAEFSVTAAAVIGGDASPMRPETAVLLRDKYLQKKRIAEAGLPVAQCGILPDFQELEALHPDGPIVIKPILGAACANTFIVRDRIDFDAVLTRLRSSGFSGPFLVEDFIQGAEHHVDGVVRDGEITFVAITKYIHNVIELQTGVLLAGVALQPGEYAGLYENVHALAHSSLEALGHRNGVFHLEVFANGDDVTFSECAGRISGGPVERFIHAQYGVDLHLEWGRIVFGQKTSVPVDISGEVHGYAFVMAPGAGTISRIPDQEEILALDGVVTGRPMVEAGYRVDSPQAASDVHIGEIVVRGDTEENVIKRLHELNDWFQSRVVMAEPNETGMP